MRFLKILDSRYAELILGFFLTGLVGSLLTHQFQQEDWKCTARHEIFKKRLDESRNIVDTVMHHSRKRFYSMQKIYWALERYDVAGADSMWDEYQRIVDDWNVAVGGYRCNLKATLSPRLAYHLLDSENAVNYKQRESLHAEFVVAHQKLKKFKEWQNGSQGERRQIELDALSALRSLAVRIDTFSEACLTAIMARDEVLMATCR